MKISKTFCENDDQDRPASVAVTVYFSDDGGRTVETGIKASAPYDDAVGHLVETANRWVSLLCAALDGAVVEP